MIQPVTDLFEDEAEFEQHDLRAGAIVRKRRLDQRRYSNGLENIDASANPLRPNGFCVIGAREGQGKTSFALRLALANACQDHRVLFVSLDMQTSVVQDRLLSHLMQVSDEHVAFLEQQQDAHFQRSLDELLSRDLLVWRPRKGQKRIEQIIARAEDVTAAILVIDYTRLIDGWDYGRKAADIVDALADWTQETPIGTTTILLSQLHNDAVNRRPHNGHLQDTTQIGQRADRVTLLYRPYKGRVPQKDTIAEILTTKNRWGPEVTNHAGWIGETMDFYPLSAEEEASARCCRSDK